MPNVQRQRKCRDGWALTYFTTACSGVEGSEVLAVCETIYQPRIAAISDRSVKHLGRAPQRDNRPGTLESSEPCRPTIRGSPFVFRESSCSSLSCVTAPRVRIFQCLNSRINSSQASGKALKHGSSHGGRRSTTGHSKPSKPKSQKPATTGTGSSSFLFVVNELQVDYEPLPGEAHPLTDQWLNPMPPQSQAAYTGELIGTVFRYQDGVVSPAQGYLWYENF